MSGLNYMVTAGITTPFALNNVNGYRPVSWSGSQLIYAKTNIAGFFFDAIMRVEHVQTLRITEHPVQSGANIVDHAYKLPARVSLEIGMSDAMDSVIPGEFSAPSLGKNLTSIAFAGVNSLTGGQAGRLAQIASGLLPMIFPEPSKSVNAYQVLKQLQDLRLPLTVVTKLDTYENMLIEQIVAPDDYKTAYGMRALVTLRQIIVAVVPKVKVAVRPQIADKNNVGQVQPSAAANQNESILSKIERAISGP